MTSNDELRKGDFLISNNKKFKAVFEEDGNLVIYGWKPIWTSESHGCKDAHRLVMQEDCNFVMYTKADNPCWHTASNASCPCKQNRLFLRDDGVLVVDNNGTEMWNSTMSKGSK